MKGKVFLFYNGDTHFITDTHTHTLVYIQKDIKYYVDVQLHIARDEIKHITIRFLKYMKSL